MTPDGRFCTLTQTGDGSLQAESLAKCVHVARAAALAVNAQFARLVAKVNK